MKSRLENSVLACGREGPKIQYTGMGDIAVDCLPPNGRSGGTPQEAPLGGLENSMPSLSEKAWCSRS